MNDDFILNIIENTHPFSTSSNKVYRFDDSSGKYILKVNNLSPDNLSPFWQGINTVCNSNFDTQRAHIEALLSLLNNPYIQTAELVSKSDKYKSLLFREVPGVSYEPDVFPDNDAIGYKLGQFIGFIHNTHYDYFGHIGSHFHSGFKEKMLSFMSEIIKKYWSDSEAVKIFFTKISQLDISPASYSLIMPDISANQFVFNTDLTAINAVVDFDAYVIGPVEWELSVIEMCLKDGKAFKKGYESCRPFPSIEGCRDFYRFFMYLCDPWEKQDLNLFMSENIRFKPCN